jgi:hypothetical protein
MELKRAVCNHAEDEFYAQINKAVETQPDMTVDRFVHNIEIHNGQNRNRQDEKRRYQEAEKKREREQNHHGRRNRDNSDQSEQRNPSEANLSQSNSNNKSKVQNLKCWDYCGKPGEKSGHPGCPEPGSKKHRPPRRPPYGNSNKGEAHNATRNQFNIIKEDYEKKLRSEEHTSELQSLDH